MNEINLPKHWEIARLGKLGSLVRGVTYKRQETTDTSSPGYLPILRATNIQDRQLLLEELVYVKGEKVSDSQLLRRGDVIIAMSSGSKSVVGKSVQLNTEWKGSFGAFCAVFRHNSMAEPFFIGHVFQTKSYREHLLKEARGTNINNLSKNHILDYQFPLPPLFEQRAIAHILQTLQEAKLSRQREIALERERKAALMDHLLSYGTKGELRKQTEIGEIPESWEVVELKKTANLRRENVKPKDSQSLNFVGLEHIDSGESTLKRWGDASKVKSAKTHFYCDDILYGKLRSYLDKAVIAEMEGICSTDILVFTVNSKILPRFLVYLLHTEAFVNHAVATSTGISHPRTSWDSLGKFTFALPPLPEQRAIAAVFQAIDEKIAALEREVEHLDELFHAMLEELMTGQRSAVPLIDAELLN